MAEKQRFTIPTLDEMESAPKPSFKAKDLMIAEKQGTSSIITKAPIKTISLISRLTQEQSSSSQSTATHISPVKSSVPAKTGPQSSFSKPVDSSALKQPILPPSTSRNAADKAKPTMLYAPVNVIESKPEQQNTAGPAVTGSPSKLGKTSILVSPRQRGNPILKFVRNVPWEFDDIVADYQLGRTTCALFLSLRYHQLNPDYIHERLKKLGHSYDLRILLVHIDIKDPHHALKELAKVCILSDCTLMVAFSPEEAGRYLETYKAFENKPPDLIMEKTEGTFLSKFTDTITSVKKVNKTDAMTLLSTFGTFEKIVNASEEDLSLCSGFGPMKAQQLHRILNEPFLKPNKRKLTKSDEKEESPKKSPIKSPSKPSK